MIWITIVRRHAASQLAARRAEADDDAAQIIARLFFIIRGLHAFTRPTGFLAAVRLR